MKPVLIFFSSFFVSLFTIFGATAQSEADTIQYFLNKYTNYKNLSIERQDLLAVAALYRSIDEKDTAWADITIKVSNKRIVDLSVTGLNKITLPESLLRLDALEGLAIKGCYLYNLPSLKAFPKLKYLGIWTSRLRDTLVVDESYKNLEVLGLHEFHAKKIRFAENLNIKTLYLIDGEMILLGKTFANLKKVEEIHVGGNRLTDFDLSMLPNLKQINCYRNQIQTINRKRLILRHKKISIKFDEY
jgi:Leucine-rich repeat (LRR) protein